MPLKVQGYAAKGSWPHSLMPRKTRHPASTHIVALAEPTPRTRPYLQRRHKGLITPGQTVLTGRSRACRSKLKKKSTQVQHRDGTATTRDANLCSAGKVRFLPSVQSQKRQTQDKGSNRGDSFGKTKPVLGACWAPTI